MSMFSRRAIGCLGRSLADRFCERLPSQLANELCEIVKVLEASQANEELLGGQKAL
jgi:hypothetical protein